jgi:hypothetical protein
MPADHPNRGKLEVALGEVNRIAGEVNERIAAEARQRAIFDVHTLLEGAIPDLVQPQRRFLTDVPEIAVSYPMTADGGGDSALSRFFGGSGGRPRTLRLCLFSDMLLLAQYSHRAKLTDVELAAAGEEGGGVAGGATGAASGGTDSHLPGVLEGKRYKLVEVIHLRDVNLSLYTKAAGTGGAAAERPKSVALSGSGVDGTFPLDITAVKQVVGKDGAAGTAVTRITLHCATSEQKQSLLAQVIEAADRVQAASRDLKERQLNAAPGRTRAWRKRSDMGTWGKSLKKGDVEGGAAAGGRGGLASLQERYAAGGRVSVGGAGGDSAGEAEAGEGEGEGEGEEEGEGEGRDAVGLAAEETEPRPVDAAGADGSAVPPTTTATHVSAVAPSAEPPPSRRPLPAFPGGAAAVGAE